MKHEFTLEYWQDDGWFIGHLKEVPGVFSQGETLAELETNIEDAYQTLLSVSAMEPPMRPAKAKPVLLEVA